MNIAQCPAAGLPRGIGILEAGRFPLYRTVSTIVPLAQAPAVLAQWSEKPSSFTKIMVKI